MAGGTWVQSWPLKHLEPQTQEHTSPAPQFKHLDSRYPQTYSWTFQTWGWHQIQNEQILTLKMFSIHVIVFMCHSPCGWLQVRDVFVEVYRDDHSPVEKRVAAFLILMKSPDRATIRDIVSSLENTRDEQLRSFVVSYLNNIRNSDEPQIQQWVNDQGCPAGGDSSEIWLYRGLWENEADGHLWTQWTLSVGSASSFRSDSRKHEVHFGNDLGRGYFVTSTWASAVWVLCQVGSIETSRMFTRGC